MRLVNKSLKNKAEFKYLETKFILTAVYIRGMLGTVPFIIVIFRSSIWKQKRLE
jgi:hypothetical protein